MSKRTLVVFEGPAGCGKTTMIQNQFEGNGYHYLTLRNQLQIDRPRSYDGLDGLRLAQIKDQVTTSDFIYSTAQTCITDRWYLSRWIYGSIRGQIKYTPRDIVRMGLRDLLYQAECASLMGVEDREAHDVDLRFVIFLPTLSVLKQLRASAPAGKTYPFDPEQELELYEQAYEELIGHTNNHRPAFFGMGTENNHVRLIGGVFIYDRMDSLNTPYLYEQISALAGVQDVAEPS